MSARRAWDETSPLHRLRKKSALLLFLGGAAVYLTPFFNPLKTCKLLNYYAPNNKVTEEVVELTKPLELRVGAYCGGMYSKTFQSFDDAAAECDRLNARDEWVATLYANGVNVRDHTAAWQ